MNKEIQEKKFTAIGDYIAAIPKIKNFHIKANLKEEAKGDMMNCVEVSDIPSPTYQDIQWLSNSIDSIRKDYWDLWDALYEHKNNGHLPPIVGAQAMTKALKAVGLDGDYSVEPKVIYASDGSISGYNFYVPVPKAN